MRPGSIALLLAALALMGSARDAAAGDPVGVAIEWAVDGSADGCAGTGRLRAEVATQVRRNAIVDASSAHAIIVGRTSHHGSTWRAEISLQRRDGTELGRRALDERGPGCGALDRALVVVLAMMIDATVLEDTAVRQAVAPELPPTIARPSRSRDETWRLALVSGGLVELGRLPGHGLGIELGIAVRVAPRWSLEATAAGWSEQTAAAGAVGTRLRQVGGALGACARVWAGAGFAVATCAGLGLGSLASHGFGFVDNRQQRAVAVDARAEARLERRVIGGWFARLGLGAWVPARRPAFAWQDADGSSKPLYQPAPVAAIGHIAVGVRFR